MSRFTSLAAASLLALGLGGAAQAQALDWSNSASATGNPFAVSMGVTQSSVGASPADDSNSASATGNPLAFGVATSHATTRVTNWSNSASALGGPGTGAAAATGGVLAFRG